MESQEVAIAWVDLTYNVKPFLFSKEKVIVNQLNGSVKFGTINALMGPSGAGKTTLLKCLNGKLSSGLDSNSKIYVNSSEKIRPCFVAQHSKEHLIMCLSAKQNMIYASKLKNSDHKSETGPIDHENNILEIMEEFLIGDILDIPVNNCSGGEQKRLTIAIEMTKVIKPNILCIDEPTTGLDSTAAETAMECLRRLSKVHRMTIITSIHQPNNEIVVMFDNIYVLAKSGNCIFSGPPHQIQTHLFDCNIIMNEEQVPIEQLLKLASIESNEQYLDEIIQKTRQSLRQSVLTESNNNMSLSPNGLQFKSKSFKPLDVWYLIMRTSSQQYIKQWKGLFSQFSFFIFFAFFTTNTFDPNVGKPSGCFNPKTLSNSTCIKDLEDDSLLLNNQNFIFFTFIMVQFVHLCYITLIYLDDIKIFINEHDNSWYSTGSYFWAKNLVEFIPSIIFSTSYAFLCYYLSGQFYTQDRVLYFILISVLGLMCTEGYGHNIGIILINFPNIAIIISIGLFSVMVMYCNFFILVKDLPLLFQYVSDWAYPKFLFNSALIIIYGLNRCSPEEKSVIFLKFNVDDSQLIPNIYKLAIYAISLRILAFLMLYLKTNISLKLKTFSKSDTKTDEIIEMNSKDLSSVEFNGNKKRLSLILNEIQSEIEKKNMGNDSNDNNIEYIPKYKSNGNNVKIVINFEKQISYSWNQMTLRIPKTLFNEEKVILRDINGFFEFGTINALMGSSGAGKTSLLKAINGLYCDYVTNETIIRLNKFRTIKTCFIVQDEREHILPGLTAGQAMIYASRLKNTEPNYDHKHNVKKIMRELLISNTFNTSVDNCSGGEQKRLVIALELTSSVKPNLVCIDEPTSGLDSNAAEVVMKCLKRLSQNHNICVITSIHQPNNEVLMLFDKLYVLSKGGQCVFSGRPQELPEYLVKCGIECTRNQVPIEVLLHHSCNGVNDKTVQKMIKKTKKLQNIEINNRLETETEIYLDGIKRVSKRFYLKDLWVLLLRALTHTYRHSWKLISIQFILYISFGAGLQFIYGRNIGVPTGCINFEDDFNKTCAKTEEKLAEETLLLYNIKYIFYVITVIIFFVIILNTMLFGSDLKVFFNEQRNGWYSTGVYYWSKSFVEFLPLIIILLIYSYITDIYEDSMFLGFFVYISIGSLEVQSISHFIAILLSSNPRLAVFTSVGCVVFAFLFSNFMVPTEDLHYSLQILSLLSPLKLILECALILYYGFDKCSDREFSFVLYFFDIQEDKHIFYRNTYLLVIQFLIFRSIAMIALLFKVNPMFNSKVRAQEKREETAHSRRPSKAFIMGLTSEFDYEVCDNNQ